MNRKIAGIVFATGMLVAALAGSASAQNSPGIAALDTALRGAVERKDVPGIVALVTDRKGVVYQGAFGVADVSSGRPLAADSMFRIASMTKPITSFALMQLVEQGKLGLDDPASKYLPELANLQVIEFVRPGNRRVQAAPRVAAGNRPAFPDPLIGPRLSVHQRHLARPETEGGRQVPVRRSAAVRSGRALALLDQH